MPTGTMSWPSWAQPERHDRSPAKRDQELQQYRENLETLVEHRTQALQHATAEAQAASRAKSDFLARMSHEIRTPMNAIVGLSKLLLKTELTAHQRDYQEKVIAASDMLLGLINDILDYSRIEAGKLEVEHIDFEIDQLMGSLVGQMALRAQQKGLELLLQCDPHIPKTLRGDPLRLSPGAGQFDQQRHQVHRIWRSHHPHPAASAHPGRRAAGVFCHRLGHGHSRQPPGPAVHPLHPGG